MTIGSYKTIINNARENRSREIQQVLELIEHRGEKGAQVETIVAGFLRELLPQKFAFSTGFIVSSDSAHPPSSQQDIIVNDALQNTSLYRSDNWGIFPVEAVYGTVEVKSTLTRDSLRKALQGNIFIRAMAEAGKYYAHFGSKEVAGGKYVVEEGEIESRLAPRFYVVSYQARSGDQDASFDLVKSWFEELSLAENVHCHGLIVLKTNWLFRRIAHAGDSPVKFQDFSDRGVERFAQGFRSSLLSFPMYPANLKRYAELEV